MWLTVNGEAVRVNTKSITAWSHPKHSSLNIFISFLKAHLRGQTILSYIPRASLFHEPQHCQSSCQSRPVCRLGWCSSAWEPPLQYVIGSSDVINWNDDINRNDWDVLRILEWHPTVNILLTLIMITAWPSWTYPALPLTLSQFEWTERAYELTT